MHDEGFYNDEYEDEQLGLVFESIPDSRVYTNIGRTKTVRALHDVLQADEPGLRYLLTGFSSLEYLLSISSVLETVSDRGEVRVLLGSEELQKASLKLNTNRYEVFKEEIRDYWLEKGMSILQLPSVTRFVRLIQKNHVIFRLLPRFHGKLYLGPRSGLVGSSNLSQNGMRLNTEINLRQDVGERDYDDLSATAERIWNLGRPAKQFILDLLNELLRVVSWQEVIARSASVVLEAVWISDWEELIGAVRAAKLWPSQRQTVAQALYVLENNDCALIADPTGSGKTRAITALHAALSIRQWHTDQPAGLRAAVVCPPGVIENWKSDFGRYPYFDPPSIVSSGILSRHGKTIEDNDEGAPLSDGHQQIRRVADYATILYIDEAHNLYNEDSARAKVVRSARAMQRVLATATPIGRSIRDLRPLLELLDLNNLSPGLRDVFKELNKLRYQELNEEQRTIVTNAITNITVRHTIPSLNEMIDREPNEYTDDYGNRCRYPNLNHRTYTMDETSRDREIAEQIRNSATELVGLTGVPREKLFASRSFWFLDNNHPPPDPVNMRLRALAGLARYKITAATRSSVPILVELIEGRASACEEFGIDHVHTTLRSSNVVGETDMLYRLKEIRRRGLTPIPEEIRDQAPTWLVDPDEFLAVVDREIEVTQKIIELGRQLSPARDDARISEIRRLHDEFGRVLVFEDSIVTLGFLHRLAKDEGLPTIDLYSGDGRAARAEKHFGLMSESEIGIGLCSAALSEGVNLQAAQAMMFVQIPIVYRHAEQRIGRIVRMNSSFTNVTLSWPKDAREFSVSTDKRLFKTANDIRATIGHNMDTPEDLSDTDERIDAEYVISLLKETHGALDPEIQIKDSFDPIRSLIYGNTAIVPDEIYNEIKGTEINVAGALRMNRVGAVESRSPFVFATVVREGRAPRFFLWTQVDDEVVSKDLEGLFGRLRALVGNGRDQRARLLDSHDLIAKAFDRFRDERRTYISNREQLAVEVFQNYAENVRKRRDWKANLSTNYRQKIEILNEIIDTGRWNDQDIDYKSIAGGLIEYVFEPARRALFESNRRKKHRTYNDVLPTLEDRPITDDTFEAIEKSLKNETPMINRTVALLVGVGKNGGES